MATHILLDVVPQRIDPAAWAEAWEEARVLLSGQRLYGYDWVTVAGVALPVYTRGVERDAGDAAARRLSVAGERATFSFGAPQTLHRDLGHYLGRCPLDGARAAPPDDVLLAAAGVEADGAAERPPPPHPVPRASRRRPAGHVRDGVVPVLGDAPCASACALPILGAAMVIEGRFPRHALVSGDVDRDRAEAARRFAEGALGRPVALPVRVDAWRLSERLGARLHGPALIAAVRRLHLAAPAARAAALIALFGRAAVEPWWLDEIGAATGDGAATRGLLAAYLEASHHDLPRLAGLTCLDARGPRWSPDALARDLAALRLGEDAVAAAFGVVFGGGAARLLAVFRAARAAPADPDPPAEVGADPPLAALESPADLTPSRRARVLAAAARARAEAERADPPARWPETFAALIAQRGPTLTEDAWAWIAREEDPSLKAFLAALAAIDLDGEVRRALFENRALCRYAAAAA